MNEGKNKRKERNKNTPYFQKQGWSERLTQVGAYKTREGRQVQP